MYDFLGTVAITSSIIVVLSATIAAMAIGAHIRLALWILLGAWVGLVVALGADGQYADADSRAFQLVGTMFAAPLVTIGALALLVPSVRAALLALPMPLLIGLNTARLFGAFFVLLALDGRLGGPFPQSAGWGDVITGLLALPVAWLAGRAATDRDWAIQAWNAFGALDLVAAVALGVVSTNGSPLQLIEAGAGSAAMQQLPWVLVPTVLVPLFLVTHAIVLAQLRLRAARKPRWAGAMLPA